MGQEEKKGHLNSCKLTENWRNLRRDAKTKELKCDVVVLKETFDRALQKKNRHIELLMQVTT
jgi:Sperm tail